MARDLVVLPRAMLAVFTAFGRPPDRNWAHNRHMGSGEIRFYGGSRRALLIRRLSGCYLHSDAARIGGEKPTFHYLSMSFSSLLSH